MFRLKIKLFCPKCNKIFSIGIMRRKSFDEISQESLEWDNKRLIFQCQRCHVNLETNAELEKIKE
jgi:hypothetical protein